MLILVTSLEYTTNRVLSHVPFLTPVDLHFGICLSAVFSSVACELVNACEPFFFDKNKYFVMTSSLNALLSFSSWSYAVLQKNFKLRGTWQ